MKILKEIIEKAIEGGWSPSGSAVMSMQEAVERLRYEEIALDKTFYRALKIPKEQALYFLEQVLDNDETAISNFWRKWTA